MGQSARAPWKAHAEARWNQVRIEWQGPSSLLHQFLPSPLPASFFDPTSETAFIVRPYPVIQGTHGIRLTRRAHRTPVLIVSKKRLNVHEYPTTPESFS